jgi:hypothetical protein
MIPPILHGLLWLARAALRAGRLPVQAAHGYADPAYRPPRLPFVSIVGPLAVAQDRGRDATKPREAMFQLPGHLLGSARAAPASVPAGALALRFDGDASVTVSVAGGNLQPDSAARQVAAQIEAVLHAAIDAGEFRNADGSIVTDPLRRAELSLVTCRWDAAGRRFAISSGRRGTAEGVRRSSVERLPGVSATALALGFDDAVSVDGRLKRHKLPAPRAMTVDVRLELWAASQGELAAMTDDLARLAEARTSFATRPALLAADANAGDTALRLLPEGEPVTPASLALLEAADGLRDRVSNRAFSAPDGALLSGPPRFRLSGTQTLGFEVNPTPLIPSPLDIGHPAPRGIALSLGVSITGASAGQRFELARLAQGSEPVLTVELEFTSNAGQLFADVISTATFASGGVSNQAVTRQRVLASSPASSERPFERGLVIHVAVVVSTGQIESWVDGEARAPGALPEPVVGQGRLLGGSDMQLSIGASGAGNPLPIDVRHAHLFSEPLGAFDVRLRASLASVRQFVPGQRLRLARSEDGYSPGQERAETTVVSIDGDTLTIFPAVEDQWPRGRTLLFADELFLQQVELRRRDDLLNQLYRLSVDYRIAALLESDFPEASAPLVELPVVDVRTLSAARAAHGVPSVKVVA